MTDLDPQQRWAITVDDLARALFVDLLSASMTREDAASQWERLKDIESASRPFRSRAERVLDIILELGP